jgi:hypothetical protein
VGARRTLQGKGALQLFSQRADKLQTQGVRRPEVEVLREPAAGIPDLQDEGLLGCRVQRHADVPRPPLREGVLETITSILYYSKRCTT